MSIPHGELGWLRALPHKGRGPGFEPPEGTGDLPDCSTPGPRGISRGARKLARTSTVIKKKKKKKKKKCGVYLIFLIHILKCSLS